MATFKVKNFEQFQHYKDRSPPWIKLYNELLDDYDFACLRDASKLHLIMIWLLASRSNNNLPYDAEWIKKRINATDKVDLDALAKAGFIIINQELQLPEQYASNTLAGSKQSACLETEGETETEKIILSGSTPDPATLKNTELKAQAAEVLQFLNSKSGRNYQPVNGTLDSLIARLREGFTVTQCRQVIAKKCRDWQNDEKMEPYLRPKTLFNRTNFANYVGELEVIREQENLQ